MGGCGVRKRYNTETQRKGGMQFLKNYLFKPNNWRKYEQNMTEYPSYSCLLLPSSKPSLKDPERLMVRVFSSSDMQEFLNRLSLQGSKETSWLVRLLLRRPARLTWVPEVGLDAVKDVQVIIIFVIMIWQHLMCITEGNSSHALNDFY